MSGLAAVILSRAIWPSSRGCRGRPEAKALPLASSGALTTTYAYDPENRLTQLQTGSSVIGTYAYDGAGDRIGKTVGSATTAYTLDLASGLPQVLAETTGSSTSAYAYAGGPLEIDQAGTTYWYLTDTLGT